MVEKKNSDLLWRQFMCAEVGGTINADDPGFGGASTFWALQRME